MLKGGCYLRFIKSAIFILSLFLFVIVAVSPVSAKQVIINTDKLNVRDGPGTEHKKIDQLHTGDIYQVIQTGIDCATPDPDGAAKAVHRPAGRARCRASDRSRRPRAGLRSGSSQHPLVLRDRKSTRLNSSHVAISYAVFCLKKKIRSGHSVTGVRTAV